MPVDLVEHDPEPDGELLPQCGLEDRLGGVPLPIQRSGVQRGAPSVRAFGDVEHHPVQMDPRITEPAGPVPEHRPDKSGARFDGRAGVAAADLAGGLLQILLDLIPCGVQRGPHLGGVVGAAEGPQQRHRLRRRHVHAWDGGTLHAFLDACRTEKDPLFPLWVLLATTGLRRGEALGLRWADVDLDAGRLRVVQTVIQTRSTVSIGEPKTDRGRRSMKLDHGTVDVLRALRHRTNQERLLTGPDFVDQGLVFHQPDGGWLRPDAVSATFLRRAARDGMPRLTLHGLRHTWATLALEQGIHPRVVQERLGHSTIAITLGIYSHVSPTLDARRPRRSRPWCSRQQAPPTREAATRHRAQPIGSSLIRVRSLVSTTTAPAVRLASMSGRLASRSGTCRSGRCGARRKITTLGPGCRPRASSSPKSVSAESSTRPLPAAAASTAWSCAPSSPRSAR